jgi:flagellar FliL protein
MAENETEDVLDDFDDEPKRGGILPLLAVLIITVGGGGWVGAKTVGPKLGPALAERALEAPKKKGGGHGGGAAEGEGSLHVVDNLVLNPASSGGSRFLLTSIALQAASPEDATELSARDLEIRDAFIMVLGTKTVEELTDIRNRAQISQELMVAIEAVMGHGVVRRILIPQFVIQ